MVGMVSAAGTRRPQRTGLDTGETDPRTGSPRMAWWDTDGRSNIIKDTGASSFPFPPPPQPRSVRGPSAVPHHMESARRPAEEALLLLSPCP